MRNFFVIITIFLFGLITLLLSFPHTFDEEVFLDQKTLAKVSPIDDRIDVDYIKNLISAYE